MLLVLKVSLECNGEKFLHEMYVILQDKKGIVWIII